MNWHYRSYLAHESVAQKSIAYKSCLMALKFFCKSLYPPCAKFRLVHPKFPSNGRHRWWFSKRTYCWGPRVIGEICCHQSSVLWDFPTNQYHSAERPICSSSDSEKSEKEKQDTVNLRSKRPNRMGYLHLRDLDSGFDIINDFWLNLVIFAHILSY